MAIARGHNVRKNSSSLIQLQFADLFQFEKNKMCRDFFFRFYSIPHVEKYLDPSIFFNTGRTLLELEITLKKKGENSQIGKHGRLLLS